MSWRRAAAVLAVAVAVSLGCAIAGVWQWSRHEDRSATVALVAVNYDAAPVPLAGLAEDGLQPDEVWRPVTVSGTYVGGAVLRNRPVSGTPAAHALGVLEVGDGPLRGHVLVVDRGWFPAADADAVSPLPQGELTAVVRLRPAEPAADRAAPSGQVQAIAVDQVLAAAGLGSGAAVRDAYGVLATEQGSPPDDVVPLPRPSADLGPHLSYAFQWWVFAVGALVGAVVLLRREASEDDAPRSEEQPGGARTSPRRRPTAEEEEDAILDAAESDPAGPVSPRS